jgi:hypothetical protein
MLKHIAALLFILVLAGQVLAGVCVCLDGKGSGHASMTCCKRKKAVTPSMKKKSCCGSLCSQPVNDNLPRSLSESSIKIPIAVRTAVEKLIISLNPRSIQAMHPPVPKRAREALLLKSNPPELYLYNHAFLI